MPKKIPFFDTAPYRNLVAVDRRLQERCTLKNVILLLKWSLKAMHLAKTNYQDFGWDKTLFNYRWMAKIGRDPAPEEYTHLEARYLIEKYGDNLDEMLKDIERKKG